MEVIHHRFACGSTVIAVIAVSTRKALFLSVHQQVHRQAALGTRAEVAMSTLKGLLPSVQPQVCCQAALGTLVRKSQ